jgi:DNA-binding NtrC family response regulator
MPMKYTVLFVDDDENVLESMRRSMHRSDFNVRCASCADDALRMMRAMPVHLVVSDQAMEGMSGIEFLNMVQRLFPDAARFLLTGHATAEMIADAINRHGIDRVYLKPCNAAELARGIQEVFARREIAARAVRIIEEGCAPEGPGLGNPGRARRNDSAEASAETQEFAVDPPQFGWDTLIRRLEGLERQPR